MNSIRRCGALVRRRAAQSGLRRAGVLWVAILSAAVGLPGVAARAVAPTVEPQPAVPSVTEFSVDISPGSSPEGIAAGPDGNMWFTEYDGDRVGRITPSGAVT